MLALSTRYSLPPVPGYWGYGILFGVIGAVAVGIAWWRWQKI